MRVGFIDMGRTKRRIIDALSAGVELSGLASAYARHGDASGAVVLLYHSVPPPELEQWIDPHNSLTPEVFEQQMRFLAEHRRVISMDELVATLEAGGDLAPGTVAITIDDGYLDNLHVAAPILARYNLPATLYLPTGLITRVENQWIDRLYSLLRTRTRHELLLAWPGTEPARWDLRDARQEADAHYAVAQRLLRAGRDEREAIIADLAAQLRPAAEPPRLTMGWEDVRQLIQRFPLFRIGAHTVEHIDLSGCDESTAHEQIAHSVNDLRYGLGVEPEHFSFPYGRSTQATRAMVAALGLKSAVASAPDPKVRPASDRFHIPRLVTACSSPLFRYWTSGAYPDLSKMLFVGRA